MANFVIDDELKELRELKKQNNELEARNAALQCDNHELKLLLDKEKKEKYHFRTCAAMLKRLP